MKRRIIKSEQAVRDVEKILDYLQAYSLKAAARLAAKLTQRVEGLASHPFIGIDRSAIEPGMRCVVVERYYLLFYIPTDETLTVTRIIDGRRDLEQAFRDVE